eukprot:scaffold31_cov263-Pinguiococcus_pyrenoidosus.AAC.24
MLLEIPIPQCPGQGKLASHAPVHDEPPAIDDSCHLIRTRRLRVLRDRHCHAVDAGDRSAVADVRRQEIWLWARETHESNEGGRSAQTHGVRMSAEGAVHRVEGAHERLRLQLLGVLVARNSIPVQPRQRLTERHGEVRPCKMGALGPAMPIKNAVQAVAAATCLCHERVGHDDGVLHASSHALAAGVCSCVALELPVYVRLATKMLSTAPSSRRDVLDIDPFLAEEVADRMRAHAQRVRTVPSHVSILRDGEHQLALLALRRRLRRVLLRLPSRLLARVRQIGDSSPSGHPWTRAAPARTSGTGRRRWPPPLPRKAPGIACQLGMQPQQRKAVQRLGAPGRLERILLGHFHVERPADVQRDVEGRLDRHGNDRLLLVLALHGLDVEALGATELAQLLVEARGQDLEAARPAGPLGAEGIHADLQGEHWDSRDVRL